MSSGPEAVEVPKRDDALRVAACYRRRVGASLERVWENVRDWEHLPWLHARAFADIECKGAGSWGWRAEVFYPDGSGGRGARSLIELRIDGVHEQYVTRVLEGAGAPAEIWTRLSPRSAHETDIVVEWCRPASAGSDERAAAAWVALYTQLWDEDEAMMQARQLELDRRRPGREGAERVNLGALSALRARLPLVVEAFGTRMRVVEQGGALRVHGLVCPHWLGPLDDAPEDDGVATCPWHGYRFDLATGRSCDGRRFRIACPGELVVDRERDHVTLVRRPTGTRQEDAP